LNATRRYVQPAR